MIIKVTRENGATLTVAVNPSDHVEITRETESDYITLTPIQLYIYNSEGGYLFTLDTFSEYTINDIKYSIKQRLSLDRVPRIFWCHMELLNEGTLKSYNVSNWSCIYI